MVAGSTAGVHGRSVRERRVAWIQTSLQLGLILGRSPPRLTVGAQNSGPDRWNDQYSRQLPRGNASTVDGCEDERTKKLPPDEYSSGAQLRAEAFQCYCSLVASVSDDVVVLGVGVEAVHG